MFARTTGRDGQGRSRRQFHDGIQMKTSKRGRFPGRGARRSREHDGERWGEAAAEKKLHVDADLHARKTSELAVPPPVQDA